MTSCEAFGQMDILLKMKEGKEAGVFAKPFLPSLVRTFPQVSQSQVKRGRHTEKCQACVTSSWGNNVQELSSLWSPSACQDGAQVGC